MQYVEFVVTRPSTGAAIPYAQVRVHLDSNGALAQLFDADGNGILNPVTADRTGKVGFAAANGSYSYYDPSGVVPVIQNQQFYDLSSLDAQINVIAGIGASVAGSVAQVQTAASTAVNVIQTAANAARPNGYLSTALYSQLAAETAISRFTAYVLGPDTGTHTDPVSGLTVPNMGVYSRSTSPAGWQWLSSLPNMFQQLGTGAGLRAVSDELVETVKVSQFYSGGVSDSVALQRAYAYLLGDAKGGIIELDRRAFSSPYLFDALALAELSTAGVNPIAIRGKGYATPIQVNSACTNFITMNGAWSAIKDLLILDPNGYCTGAYIKAQPTTGAPSLPREITGVRAIGPSSGSTATLLVNNGGQQLVVDNLRAQNTMGLFWNQGGGVDSVLSRLYGLGIKYGIRLDGNTTYGHAENLQVTDATMCCTQAGGIGVWITDSLACRFRSVVGAQLGAGGIGMYMDGSASNGSVLTEVQNCYFEGSSGGVAIKSRGNNLGWKMMGGGIGQGAWNPNVIYGIDFDGVADFRFDNVEALFPNANAAKIATFANSTGVIAATCRGWNLAAAPSTETACDITWELPTTSCPVVRSTTSRYPNASWSTFAPTVSSGVGSFTSLGAVDMAYRVSGKTVSVRLKIPIVTNGTAARSVYSTLPLPAVSGKVFMGTGRENGVSGKMLQTEVLGTGVTITNYDNTYPGADGAEIDVTFTYEAA